MVRSTRLLAVNSDRLGWRATFGPCPTAPEVEVSRDGGKTWRPTDTGLRSVSRLRSYNESSVFAVGGDGDCDARYVATGGPAEDWAPNSGMLGETWYRLPDETRRVHAPNGRTSSPCAGELGDLAGLGDDNAAALCTDGQVRLTQDGGRSWRDLRGGDGAMALNADDGVYVLALRDPDCDGVGVTVMDPGVERVDGDDVRCAPVGEVSAGGLAVGIRGQDIWLWAGDQVVTSTNRGRNWDESA